MKVYLLTVLFRLPVTKGDFFNNAVSLILNLCLYKTMTYTKIYFIYPSRILSVSLQLSHVPLGEGGTSSEDGYPIFNMFMISPQIAFKLSIL